MEALKKGQRPEEEPSKSKCFPSRAAPSLLYGGPLPGGGEPTLQAMLYNMGRITDLLDLNEGLILGDNHLEETFFWNFFRSFWSYIQLSLLIVFVINCVHYTTISYLCYYYYLYRTVLGTG